MSKTAPSNQQEKLLPLYSQTGHHIGTITTERALIRAADGQVSLRYKGRGRKARVTAAHEIFQKTASHSGTTITAREVELFALIQAAGKYHLPLSSNDTIRSLNRTEDKLGAWPEIHDDRAVIICAGQAHGVKLVPSDQFSKL
jgi:hypothetical protein